MTRLWQPRESRLLAEYLAQKYPKDTVMYRVRLGQLPAWAASSISEGVPADIYKVYQRWADAIVITKTHLILMEAKIKPDPGVISQIMLYNQLIPKTEALQQHRSLKRLNVLLIAQRDSEVEELARNNNITIEYFSPTWVKDYLIEIRKYRLR